MRKAILLLLPFFLISCGLANSNFLTKNYELNKISNANVGDVILSQEQGSKNDVYGNVNHGIKTELVYSGKDHNVLLVDYREYNMNASGTFIKEGFTQHLRYDLNESKTISFRNYKIEIIKANSNNVTYKVIAE